MITTQKLHSILRKGGLVRSKSITTSVPGYHNYAPGYYLFHYVGDRVNGITRLEFRADRSYKYYGETERQCLELASKILTKAGIKFERKETDYSKELVINLNQ